MDLVSPIKSLTNPYHHFSNKHRSSQVVLNKKLNRSINGSSKHISSQIRRTSSVVPLLHSVLHSFLPLILQEYCIFYGSMATEVNKIDTVPTFIFSQKIPMYNMKSWVYFFKIRVSYILVSYFVPKQKVFSNVVNPNSVLTLPRSTRSTVCSEAGRTIGREYLDQKYVTGLLESMHMCASGCDHQCYAHATKTRCGVWEVWALLRLLQTWVAPLCLWRNVWSCPGIHLCICSLIYWWGFRNSVTGHSPVPTNTLFHVWLLNIFYVFAY